MRQFGSYYRQEPLYLKGYKYLASLLSLPREVMEKAVALHSSTLAWKVPWTEEPGGLQSTGLLRVGHDWATSLSLLTFMHWRKKWQPTPVFLPGESQGLGSLVGCQLWCCTELDMTEATEQQKQRSYKLYICIKNTIFSFQSSFLTTMQ